MSNLSIPAFNQAISGYRQKWGTLVRQSTNQTLFQDFRPTAIGWKVADLAEYDQAIAVWRDDCDQIHAKWMNNRWITTMYLRDGTQLEWGIRMVKIMQRRPGSTDALGLDHLDFYSPHLVSTKPNLIANEPHLHITDEENGPCKWLSVWFDGTEAKLRTDTTIAVCATELLDAQKDIIG